LTHWLVAVCVLINFFNESGFWHRTIGYGCLGLVLLRICDGLWISKQPASQFYLPSFSAIKAHMKELISGNAASYIGHNPLGQSAVYAMWLLIALLAFTGWLSRTDQYWGEDWPVDIHNLLSDFLQGMVVLHLLAVVLMSKLQGRNLIFAMIRGK
jgi:cytochrome b